MIDTEGDEKLVVSDEDLELVRRVIPYTEDRLIGAASRLRFRVVSKGPAFVGGKKVGLSG